MAKRQSKRPSQPSDIVMAGINRSAIIVLAKQPFLDWLHSIDPSSVDMTLDDLNREPTVYLLPQCDDEEAVDEYLKEVYAEIFEEELWGWWTDQSAWPANRTLDTFRRWFDCQFHSMVIDLSSDPLIRERR